MSSTDLVDALWTRPRATTTVTLRPDGAVVGRTRAMATDVTVTAHATNAAAVATAVASALDVFHDVETQCTRFDPHSPLMRANRAREEWVAVPALCFRAIVAAADAHRRTGGRFDPRVHDDLVRLGYDNGHLFDADAAADTAAADTAADAAADDTVAATPAARSARPAWQPEFRLAGRLVKIGPCAIDLGGIGKGLAVTWAAERLGQQIGQQTGERTAERTGEQRARGDGRATSEGYLVEAGGDCFVAGSAPDGGPWRIGVEDPLGGADPVLVLALRDRAVTTSSVRIRRWRAGDRQVHHLIDPSTGLPGGDGLLAVTVVGEPGATAADAEVDGKTLFLCGRAGIAAAATDSGVAACWVTADGTVTTSPAFDEHVVWRRP